ncbi:hypothetical protein HFO96_21185 [Rhizobium leguminosarum]|nr:hypothetical protein [Rhizobium leguminosarum]
MDVLGRCTATRFETPVGHILFHAHDEIHHLNLAYEEAGIRKESQSCCPVTILLGVEEFIPLKDARHVNHM